MDEGVDRLPQVVRRDVGRHPDGNTGGPIHEQVGEIRGQDDRLLPRLVIVGPEADGLFLQVEKQLLRHRVEARLGIALGRGRVAIHGAEVPLALDERVAQREILDETHHGVVDRDRPVRVVIAGDVSGDLRRLAVRPVVVERKVVHGDENPALHRLQPVAHVGQRPRHDDAHRVVDVRGLHLVLDEHRVDPLPGRAPPGVAVRRLVFSGRVHVLAHQMSRLRT